MKKKLTALSLALLMCVALLTPMTAATDYAGRAYEINDYISEYSLAYKDSYDIPLLDALEDVLKDNPELFRQLVDAMFAKLDDYSMYLSKEEYGESFDKDTTYVGVGITLDTRYPFGVVVGSVAPYSPADEGGIKVGDIILSVDSKDVRLMNYKDMVPLALGEFGTKLKLAVLRQDAGRMEFELERRIIRRMPNVTYEYADNGVGIINLGYFGGFIDYLEFADAYYEFAADEKVKSLIIDVRGNRGGGAETLHRMLDCMVKAKGVTLFKLVNSEDTEIYKSTGEPTWTPDKTIVLIDQNSASAAEVFAGSLQKLGLAEVVGENSYGKARSQYHFELSDGSVAVITAHEVLLPDGSSYEGVGITPDFAVPYDGKPYPFDTLGKLNTGAPLYKGKTSEAVKAMQQRLDALGLHPVEPNGYFGDITLWSLNVFQKSKGLKVTSYATAETLKALEKAVKELKVYEDSPMEFALKRLRDAE